MYYDYVIKMIFIGGPCVGKTSLLCNYCNKHYETKYTPTIGVDFHTTYHRINDKTIKCHVWDTAGQEQFKSIIYSFFKGIAAAICMFDVSRPETLDEAKDWIKTATESSSGTHLPILLIANKTDLRYNSFLIVEAKKYCTENGYDFIETSVSQDVGVSDAMESIVQKVYNEIIVTNVHSPGVKTSDENTSGVVKLDKPSNRRRCCTIF
jgi:small GTP-binding protein